MRRSKRLAGLTLALLLAACASERVAAPELAVRGTLEAIASTGCPASWDAGPPTLDTWMYDLNGDNLVCTMWVGNPFRAGQELAIIDNHVPGGTVGNCPNGFDKSFTGYVPEGGSYHPKDNNEDLIVCVSTKSNGEVVTIDNNVKVTGDGK